MDDATDASARGPVFEARARAPLTEPIGPPRRGPQAGEQGDAQACCASPSEKWERERLRSSRYSCWAVRLSRLGLVEVPRKHAAGGLRVARRD